MYKPPGTYARFVKTVSPVVDAGGSRIMAIVGTGINYYTVENEAITKSNTKPYDVLQNENVFEILNVSSKPIYNNLITSNNTIYYPSSETQKGYRMSDNVITWDSLVDADITVDYKQCPSFYVYTGDTDNGTPIYNIEYSVDETALYPVEDGNWVIEVSYINEDDVDNNPKLGCYRIINADTSEIIGEYVVSDEAVTNEDGTYPIPGVRLVVKNTYIVDSETQKQAVFVGDYIKLHTIGAKTETEATAYKYNLSNDQEISNLDVELTTTPESPTEEKITAVKIQVKDSKTDDNYILSDKFKIYIKTSAFEGLTDNDFTTEDLNYVYCVGLNGRYDYKFKEDELNTVTGLTTLKAQTYKVGIKFSTRKPTQREINNKTFDAENTTTADRRIIEVTFSWNSYDGNKFYTVKAGTNEPTSFTKATYTIPIASYTLNETSNKMEEVTIYEENKDFATVALDTYTYKTTDDTVTTYYDRYAKTDVEVFTNDITSFTDVSQLSELNKTVDIVYDETAENKSSAYNENTQFYILACALDENGNVLDFASSSTTTETVANLINTDGENIVSGNSAIDNNDEDYAGTITSTDSHINQVISMMTAPTATTSEGNGILYSAINNITIISNEQLYQTPAVYKLNILTIDEQDYFRIVRYVNGVEDNKFTDYNGAMDEATFNAINFDGDVAEDLQNIKTNKLYKITDGDIFDVIPGVAFDYDITMSANIPNGSQVLIISSPRITSTDVPAEGSTYYISYKYRKADADYEPKFFDNYDDIVAEYGNYDVSASSAVLNSISLGAEIAFNNGVSQIVCVQARNNSDYEMQTAIDRLQKSIAGANNVATVVPLSTSDSVGAYLSNHVDLMSSYDYGKERMGYLGARIGQQINKFATKDDRTLGMVSVAESYDNERIVYVVPGAIQKQIRDLRTGRYNVRTLPGCYAAVAVAAVGLSHDPAEPLTYKTLSGFTQLVDLYSESEKNELAAAGCCVLEQNGSTIRIRHGITTNNDDVNSQEITLIQIKDYVIDSCRTITADTYIGRKLTQTIIADIKYTMENLLNNFISQGVIINFSSLKVKRSTLDPRQVDVSFEIEAVYPLNWISIEFGFSAVS